MNYFVIFFIIFIDQILKMIIRNRLYFGESIPIIQNIFHITYVQNVGAAFGILKYQRIFFIFITLAVIIGIFIFVFMKHSIHKIVLHSLNLIVGGATGNLIDRAQFGYVIDFLDFRIWPVFNVADISIVAGTVMLAYYFIFLDKKDYTKI